MSQGQTSFANQDLSGLPLQEMANQYVSEAGGRANTSIGSASADAGLSGTQFSETRDFNIGKGATLGSGLNMPEDFASQQQPEVLAQAPIGGLETAGTISGTASQQEPEILAQAPIEGLETAGTISGTGDIPQSGVDASVGNTAVLDPELNLTASKGLDSGLQPIPEETSSISAGNLVQPDPAVNIISVASTEELEPNFATLKGLSSEVQPAQTEILPTIATENLAQPVPDAGLTSAAGSGALSGAMATKEPIDLKGTFIFSPIEGKFLSDQGLIGKMDPYCKVTLGFHSGKTSVAKDEGLHPVWNDAITLERKHNEEFAKIKVKDNDKITFNDNIGEAKIPLHEVALKGASSQWYPIFKKEKQTGEILVNVSFQPKEVPL